MADETLDQSPSRAEIIYSQVVRTSNPLYVGLAIPTTLRLPIHLMASVDEFASRAGVSRNYMLSQLIECGLDSVFSVMSSDDLQEISEAQDLRYPDLMEKSVSIREGK